MDVRDYHHALDGFAISAPASALGAIKSVQGVKDAFVDGEREPVFYPEMWGDGGVAVAVVLTFVVIFFTERGLSAKWGVVLKDDPMGSASAEGRMAIRVSDLSRAYNLSPREEEVLQLIAQGDTVAEIEEVLYVSQGTVKAHINHIYRKFNIHSKSELFELLNDVEKPVRKGRRSSSSAWEDEERQAG